MRQWLAPVLVLFATTSPAQELKKFDFEPPPRSAQSRSTSAVCAFDNLAIPEGLRVYAAGAYSGREVGFQIDQSGHEATQFDIAVNSPQPVAFMLGAYEPTIWNIGWTKQTRIVAVVVSGYHRQVVAGLKSGIPVLNSSYDNKGPCGYFYVGKERNTELNPLSRQLFKKPVDLVYPGDRTGKIVIGDPLENGADLVTAATPSPESFRDTNAPLAGQPGLDSAVEKGLIRLATAADAAAWVAAIAANEPALDVPPVAGQGIPSPPKPQLHNAYVVLKQFTYPAGLYGAHAATFFIPRGVPKPTGNPGHSAVYDFNTLTCRGGLCR